MYLVHKHEASPHVDALSRDAFFDVFAHLFTSCLVRFHSPPFDLYLFFSSYTKYLLIIFFFTTCTIFFLLFGLLYTSTLFPFLVLALHT